MSHPSLRAVYLSIFLALVACAVLVLGGGSAMAGVAAEGLSLPRLSPVHYVKEHSVHKPKKGCLLCNDKGYCVDEANKQDCQTSKSAIQKTWGPGYTWKCVCSKKAQSPSGEGACCWPTDNPAKKDCGEANGAKSSAVVNNPGKAIQCGPYQKQ